MTTRPRAPPPFLALADEIIISLFARVPFFLHGTVRIVSRRLNELISSSAFYLERVESGYAETGIVKAGGREDGRCWILSDNGRWRPIAAMSFPRQQSSSLVHEGAMWVIGGCAFVDASTAVERFDVRTNTWESLPPIPADRGRFEAAVGSVGGFVVVAGGAPDSQRQSVIAYSPATGWIDLPEMPYSAFAPGACVLDGCLFVAGDHYHGKLQMWDGCEWTLKANLPCHRDNAASVACQGKLWVIGGRVLPRSPRERHRILDEVVVYEPRTDTWTAGEPLPEPRCCCRAFEKDGGILVLGGSASLDPSVPDADRQELPPLFYRHGAWTTMPGYEEEGLRSRDHAGRANYRSVQLG